MTHIEYLNEWEVRKVLPFLRRVVTVSYDNDRLELFVQEVAGSQRHHEVAEANQRRARVGEQTHDDVVREVGRGGLLTILAEGTAEVTLVWRTEIKVSMLGAIQVLRNAFFWKFDTLPPPTVLRNTWMAPWVHVQYQKSTILAYQIELILLTR